MCELISDPYDRAVANRAAGPGPEEWTEADLEPYGPDECQGHPAGEFDPMGQTVYCDGSCRA